MEIRVVIEVGSSLVSVVEHLAQAMKARADAPQGGRSLTPEEKTWFERWWQYETFVEYRKAAFLDGLKQRVAAGEFGPPSSMTQEEIGWYREYFEQVADFDQGANAAVASMGAKPEVVSSGEKPLVLPLASVGSDEDLTRPACALTDDSQSTREAQHFRRLPDSPASLCASPAPVVAPPHWRTPERAAILRRVWPDGTDTQLCIKMIEARPGGSIPTPKALNVARWANALGVKRPAGHQAKMASAALSALRPMAPQAKRELNFFELRQLAASLGIVYDGTNVDQVNKVLAKRHQPSVVQVSP